MSRDLDASLVTESTAQFFSYLIFVSLGFDSGTLYVHNGIGSIAWGGNTYQGVGDFGGISAIEEGAEVSPYAVSLVLSGLDATMMDEAINQNYYLRPVTVYLGALNSSGALVADPDQIWSGKMDVMEVVLGSTNVIRLVCESDMAIFEKTNGKLYTNPQLQSDYSGDLLFEYLDQMVDAKVVWRGRGSNSYGGSRVDISDIAGLLGGGIFHF